MIKLAAPFIPESAIASVCDIIRSGNLVQGEYVKQFEKQLSDYIGSKHSILVSSGTAALHLSLLALDIKPGDEVAMPAFCFPAIANVVELIGAKPVFADILLQDFCIDPDGLESIINKKTKAIIVVHEFGQSAAMDEIIRIAAEKGIPLIEDAACALGTEFNNKKAGTFGITGCFSFHPRKIITTGEGGLVTTDNDEIAEKIRCLRNHGIFRSGNETAFISAGLNYRMTEFQAAIGIGQLEIIDEIVEKRIEIASLYRSLLINNLDLTLPKIFPDRKNVYQTFLILLKSVPYRDKLIMELAAAGVEAGLGAQAIPLQSYYLKKYRYSRKDFTRAMYAFEQGLALPMGMHMDREKTEYIAQIINNGLYKQ